ncbi:uncharacterized protein V6R79_008894 [Siganus canaliculatus]
MFSRAPMRSTGSNRGILTDSFGRSYSSGKMESTETTSGEFQVTAVLEQGYGRSTGGQFMDLKGPKVWCVFALSVLSSVVVVTAVGCLCALLYPILRGKYVPTHARAIQCAVKTTPAVKVGYSQSRNFLSTFPAWAVR